MGSEVKTKINKKSIHRKVVIVIGTLCLLAVVAVIAVSLYVGWSLLKPERETIGETPEKYGLAYESVQFRSQRDNVRLNGWWISAQKNGAVAHSPNTVIFAHGYGNNRAMNHISAIQLANRLTAEGYNVLAFDFRRSGESEGAVSTIGYLEKFDLLAAIDYAKQRKKSKTVALIGWSMGGVTAILSGVESKDVSVIIADSPFSDLREYLEVNLPHWSELPSFPFTPIILAILPVMAGVDVDAVSPYRAVEHLDGKKLLLIHSKADEAIPYTESKRIYESAQGKGDVDLWLTEKGEHVQSYVTDREAYERRVLNWLGSVTKE